jgi:hypothetical protein
MRYRIYGTVFASLSVIALFAANETFAASQAANRAAFNSPHPTHPLSPSIWHHRRRNLGAFWPGDYFYGPSNGEPTIGVTQPPSGDIHQTYTYDVPWDWAHRYPPSVRPSDRPYVSSCPPETVNVPGRDGAEQTITIMRCY